ncbi:hypothetical protein IFR05_005091 [Cadophora sp. M221]|nr:hypothetical protein IFR05_005091 [Cadophora sp. M221]
MMKFVEDSDSESEVNIGTLTLKENTWVDNFYEDVRAHRATVQEVSLSSPAFKLKSPEELVLDNPTPTIVFRAAGPSSQGMNSRWGIKSSRYNDRAMEDILSFDAVARNGQPPHEQAGSLMTKLTLSHFDKTQTMSKSGWISTTTSLNRAIRILFVEHPEDGEIIVISLDCRSRCDDGKDVYTARELAEYLPGLEGHDAVKYNSNNEVLIWGKVEEHEILGHVSVQAMRQSCLNLITPGLLKIKFWTVGESHIDEEIQWKWRKNFERLEPKRRISDSQTAAAVQLATPFEVNDLLLIVKKFLSEDFRLDPDSRPADDVLLERTRCEKQRLKLSAEISGLCDEFRAVALAVGPNSGLMSQLNDVVRSTMKSINGIGASVYEEN